MRNFLHLRLGLPPSSDPTDHSYDNAHLHQRGRGSGPNHSPVAWRLVCSHSIFACMRVLLCLGLSSLRPYTELPLQLRSIFRTNGKGKEDGEELSRCRLLL